MVLVVVLVMVVVVLAFSVPIVLPPHHLAYSSTRADPPWEQQVSRRICLSPCYWLLKMYPTLFPSEMFTTYMGVAIKEGLRIHSAIFFPKLSLFFFVKLYAFRIFRAVIYACIYAPKKSPTTLRLRNKSPAMLLFVFLKTSLSCRTKYRA